MIFSPDKPYEISTLYTVKLDKSLKHPGELSMENDFSFQFFTNNRNQLELLGCYPTPGMEYVNYGTSAPFEFRFDNKLNSTLARDAVKIYDSKGEEISKVPRSIKVNSVSAPYGSLAFTLSGGLIENETYRVVIDRNMVDVNGIDIVEPMDYTFKAVDIRVTDRTVGMDMEATGAFTYSSENSVEGFCKYLPEYVQSAVRGGFLSAEIYLCGRRGKWGGCLSDNGRIPSRCNPGNRYAYFG